MANYFYNQSRLNIFNIADLVSMSPIKIRKVRFRPAGETNTAVLQTCDVNATPDCSEKLLLATVASTSVITAASGTPFDGAATGDWLHITNCSTATDNGWYFIKTYSTTTSITVENGVNALTDGSGDVTMNIEIFSPENAMMFVADDISTLGDNVVKDVIDWGDKGRWFPNLSMFSISSTSCYLDIYYM